MRRKFSSIALALVLAMPMLVLGPAPASALTISPVLVEYDVQPGDALVGSVKLRNEGQQSATFFTDVQDFEAAGDDGAPSFIGKAETRSLVDWVSFDQRSVTLGPGESKFVTYNLRVPSNAAAGGYHGGLLFSTSPPNVDEGIGAVGVTGALMLIRVAGEVEEAASIADFSVRQDTVTSLPVDFNIRFENEGSVHLKPSGVIRITNMFGGTSDVIRVNEDGGNVLPDSERSFAATWQKNALDENSSEFTKEWRNFAFGPYTATLIMDYGQDGEVVSATTSFWAIPWLLIVLFIILLIAIGLLVVQYNHWVVARAMDGKRK